MTATHNPTMIEAPTCSARTGYFAGEFHEEPLFCGTSRGLRTYIDRSGTTRRFCANHEGAVRRRYPEAEEPESADPITQAKYLAELAEGVAHFEAHLDDIAIGPDHTAGGHEHWGDDR